MVEVVKLLVAGITMGWGPCLVFWGPVLLPYIAATKGSWRQGLRISCMFSLGRLLALAILGGLVTVAFAPINRLFPPHRSGYLYLAIAAFIVAMGLVIILGKGFRLPLHRIVERHMVGGGSISMFILGFAIGISPCAPLIAILTYIAYTATNPAHGIVYGLSFGIGTITPVVILGTLAGFVPERVVGRPRLIRVLRVICGMVLILFGLQLIYGIGQLI